MHLSMQIQATSLVLVAALAIAACDDPAKGKPRAEVGTAQPTATASEGRVQYTLVTDQSKVDFVGSKVTGKHDGGFKSIKGTANVEGTSPETSTVEIDIDMKSVWTDDERLTGHLKSADFFDVENHPNAKFVSTKIEKSGSAYTVTGNLTLHGQTKSIKFPATITLGDDTATVKADFSINRQDFGIAYAGKPDDLIRDDVVIKLDTTFKRQKQS